jgi:hypothetical protein
LFQFEKMAQEFIPRRPGWTSSGQELIEYTEHLKFNSDRPRQGQEWCVGATIKNLKEEEVWICHRDFRFEGRVSCGQIYMRDPLEPLEKRHLLTNFEVGECQRAEQKRDARAESLYNQGRRRSAFRVVKPLEAPEDLIYEFKLDVWNFNPHLAEEDRPLQTIQVYGMLTIPEGTRDNFCVHYDADILPRGKSAPWE